MHLQDWANAHSVSDKTMFTQWGLLPQLPVTLHKIFIFSSRRCQDREELMLCMQWWLGTTAVPCQIDTISTPGENQDFWAEEESSKARPDGRKKVSAFRVNVLIDGGRRVAFMHWNFSLQPCYNELKKIAFWSTPYSLLFSADVEWLVATKLMCGEG